MSDEEHGVGWPVDENPTGELLRLREHVADLTAVVDGLHDVYAAEVDLLVGLLREFYDGDCCDCAAETGEVHDPECFQARVEAALDAHRRTVEGEGGTPGLAAAAPLGATQTPSHPEPEPLGLHGPPRLDCPRCGHPLREHSSNLNCRTCKQECGLDASRWYQ